MLKTWDENHGWFDKGSPAQGFHHQVNPVWLSRKEEQAGIQTEVVWGWLRNENGQTFDYEIHPSQIWTISLFRLSSTEADQQLRENLRDGLGMTLLQVWIARQSTGAYCGRLMNLRFFPRRLPFSQHSPGVPRVCHANSNLLSLIWTEICMQCWMRGTLLNGFSSGNWAEAGKHS